MIYDIIMNDIKKVVAVFDLKRAIHLSLHGKSSRVRRKNYKRVHRLVDALVFNK